MESKCLLQEGRLSVQKKQKKKKNIHYSHHVSPICMTPGVKMARRNLVFYVIYIYCVRSMHLFCTLQKLNPMYMLEVSQGLCSVPNCPVTDIEMPFLCGWITLTAVVSKMPESLAATPQARGMGPASPHNQPERKTKHASLLPASLLSLVGSLWTRLATLVQPPSPAPSVPTTKSPISSSTGPPSQR